MVALNGSPECRLVAHRVNSRQRSNSVERCHEALCKMPLDLESLVATILQFEPFKVETINPKAFPSSDYLLPFPCELTPAGWGQCRDPPAADSAADLLEIVCRDPSAQQSSAKQEDPRSPDPS
jgi:hypothetical protein